MQLIGDEGYRALTTTRIEAITGVSRGLVSYHFGSKQGLIEAVIRHVQAAFVDHIVGLQRAEWSCGIDGVLGLVKGYLGQLLNDPRRSRVVLILTVESIAGQPALKAAIQLLNAVLRDSLREQLVQGQQDGSIRVDLDPTTEALVLAGILRGLTVQWLADPTGVELLRATDSVVALVNLAYKTG